MDRIIVLISDRGLVVFKFTVRNQIMLARSEHGANQLDFHDFWTDAHRIIHRICG